MKRIELILFLIGFTQLCLSQNKLVGWNHETAFGNVNWHEAGRLYVGVHDYYGSLKHFESELKKKVLDSGDIVAYQKLRSIYMDTMELREDFFVYAFVMAEKYNITEAYYDVFTCMIDFYPYKNGNMDKKSSKMTIHYLLQAAQRGCDQAQLLVEKYNILDDRNSKKQIKVIRKNEEVPLFWK